MLDMDMTNKFIFSPILKKAIEEAKLSTHQHRVAAVIFKGKRIISIAHNAVRSNKVPYRFKNFLESAHAETQAILKAKRSLSEYDMLVIRLGKNNELMMAKPCEFCAEFIDYVSIRNVYYSDGGKIILLNRS